MADRALEIPVVHDVGSVMPGIHWSQTSRNYGKLAIKLTLFRAECQSCSQPTEPTAAPSSLISKPLNCRLPKRWGCRPQGGWGLSQLTGGAQEGGVVHHGLHGRPSPVMMTAAIAVICSPVVRAVTGTAIRRPASASARGQERRRSLRQAGSADRVVLSCGLADQGGADGFDAPSIAGERCPGRPGRLGIRAGSTRVAPA